jgi:large subunit ribosomal protein L2
MVFIKKYKPVTPGTRFKVILKNKKLNKNKLSKKLVTKLNKKGGRNNLGRITVRGRGGGHKRRYRKILFKRKLFYGSVCDFEYDPNRTAFLAKIFSFDTSEYFYIIAPKNLIIGDEINYSDCNNFRKILVGDSMLLRYIPIGSLIHNIELQPGRGGQLVRTAGNFAQLMEKVDNSARVRLSSGEQRLIPLDCFASFGVIDNSDYRLVNLGKAGTNRWLGRRPKVRGVAMNPVDHPHGGGEGRTSGGRPSVTPKGRYTKGQPTRKKAFGKNIIISSRVLKNLKKSSNRRGKLV